MSAPPPAKKQRKTEEQASPAAAAGGGGGALSIEMIGRVASFANYGSDLMNICKAVGRKDSAIVRFTCLRNNMGHLQRILADFPRRNHERSIYAPHIDAWMEVNTDWRRHCTLERTKDKELMDASREDGEDQRSVNIDPLLIFNNPAVAIELGQIDILKYLVEEVGIDINSHAWSGYLALRKVHLIVLAVAVAAAFDIGACLNYILSRTETDVHQPVSGCTNRNRNPVWEAMLFAHCSSKTFQAIVEHRSFEPNQFDGNVLSKVPLIAAFATCMSRTDQGDPMEGLVQKFKILLDVGADPELDLGGGRTPLNSLSTGLDRFDFSGRSPLCVRVGRQLIAEMEAKVAGEG